MGRLLVLDGLDGSGKTTQLAHLGAYLSAAGTSYKQISFPDYDKPSSAPVKEYLNGVYGSADEVNAYAASSFYAVDRYASYRTCWQADYEAGTLIVAARYTTSNAIHQMGKLPRAQWDDYLAWLEDYEYRLLGLPRPDQVLFLDMPPEVADTLVTGRYGGDPARKDIHERNAAYLRACRPAALYAAERLGWQVVPCAEAGTPLSIAHIHEDIVRRIQDIL